MEEGAHESHNAAPMTAPSYHKGKETPGVALSRTEEATIGIRQEPNFPNNVF